MSSKTYERLINAITSGKLNLIHKLLTENPKLKDTTCPHGNIPLHEAYRSGNLAVIRLVLKFTSDKHAALQTENDKGATPFLTAVRFGNADIIKELTSGLTETECKNLTEHKDHRQHPALYYAVAYRSAATTQALLELQGPISAKAMIFTYRVNSDTLLHHATRKHLNEATLIALLDQFSHVVEKGNTITARELNKSTDLEQVKQLLLTQDKDGNTPLHLATRWGSGESVRHLVYLARACGIETELLCTTNNAQEFPLHIAIRYRDETILPTRLIPEEFKGINKKAVPMQIAEATAKDSSSSTPTSADSSEIKDESTESQRARTMTKREFFTTVPTTAQCCLNEQCATHDWANNSLLRYCVEHDNPRAFTLLERFIINADINPSLKREDNSESDIESYINQSLCQKHYISLVTIASTKSTAMLTTLLKKMTSEECKIFFSRKIDGSNAFLMHYLSKLYQRTEEHHRIGNILALISMLGEDTYRGLCYIARYATPAVIAEFLRTMPESKRTEYVEGLGKKKKSHVTPDWFPHSLDIHVKANTTLHEDEDKRWQSFLDIVAACKQPAEETTVQTPINDNGYQEEVANPKRLTIKDPFSCAQRLGITTDHKGLNDAILRRDYKAVEAILMIAPSSLLAATSSKNYAYNPLSAACKITDPDICTLIIDTAQEVGLLTGLLEKPNRDGQLPLFYVATYADLGLLNQLNTYNKPLAEIMQAEAEATKAPNIAHQLMHNPIRFSVEGDPSPPENSIVFKRRTDIQRFLLTTKPLHETPLEIAVPYTTRFRQLLAHFVASMNKNHADYLLLTQNTSHTARIDLATALTPKIILALLKAALETGSDETVYLLLELINKNNIADAINKEIKKETVLIKGNQMLHYLCQHSSADVLLKLYNVLGYKTYQTLAQQYDRNYYLPLQYCVRYQDNSFMAHYLTRLSPKLLMEHNENYTNEDMHLINGQESDFFSEWSTLSTSFQTIGEVECKHTIIPSLTKFIAGNPHTDVNISTLKAIIKHTLSLYGLFRKIVTTNFANIDRINETNKNVFIALFKLLYNQARQVSTDDELQELSQTVRQFKIADYTQNEKITKEFSQIFNELKQVPGNILQSSVITLKAFFDHGEHSNNEQEIIDSINAALDAKCAEQMGSSASNAADLHAEL